MREARRHHYFKVPSPTSHHHHIYKYQFCSETKDKRAAQVCPLALSHSEFSLKEIQAKGFTAMFSWFCSRSAAKGFQFEPQQGLYVLQTNSQLWSYPPSSESPCFLPHDIGCRITSETDAVAVRNIGWIKTSVDRYFINFFFRIYEVSRRKHNDRL
jgi:hypothetical protein